MYRDVMQKTGLGLFMVLLVVNAALAGTGSISLIDASGLDYLINTDTTSGSYASGGMSEATYTAAVVGTTTGGGTQTVALSDAFDGYNNLAVNGVLYNDNGAPSMACSARQVVFNAQTVDSLSVVRKVFVPDNDEFARWLNIITNNGSSTATVNVVLVGNLGSDSSTTLDDTSSGDQFITSADNWAVTNGDNGDPRLGHIIQGPGACVAADMIVMGVGDYTAWGYDFDIAPGETAIIMNFVTGQPSIAAAAAKCQQIVALPANTLQCMSAAEVSQVVNFAGDDGDGDGLPDSCDTCPDDSNNDADGDGVCGDVDNCPNTANADQADSDGDGVGDACTPPPAEQETPPGCCGAAGPLSPLGLAVGMLLLSRYGGYRTRRRNK